VTIKIQNLNSCNKVLSSINIIRKNILVSLDLTLDPWSSCVCAKFFLSLVCILQKCNCYPKAAAGYLSWGFEVISVAFKFKTSPMGEATKQHILHQLLSPLSSWTQLREINWERLKILWNPCFSPLVMENESDRRPVTQTRPRIPKNFNGHIKANNNCQSKTQMVISHSHGHFSIILSTSHVSAHDY
jgi:hypothetical protein